MPPLLTLEVVRQLRNAGRAGALELECSLDLGRTRTRVRLDGAGFVSQEGRFTLPADCRERTVYYWDGSGFVAAARYSDSLVKLVPTEWGPPTFEIDGIKMLPTARLSPYVDAQRKVRTVHPVGARVLDCCGGLGYFAAQCLQAGARSVLSFERSADVLWLRGLNPWSPRADDRLTLVCADVVAAIGAQANGAFDAVLHDPPRFGIAGELYSQRFYDQLARVLRRRGRLFHYTGTPNRLTSGRDVPNEVARRLRRAGFDATPAGDGVYGVRN